MLNLSLPKIHFIFEFWRLFFLKGRFILIRSQYGIVVLKPQENPT